MNDATDLQDLQYEPLTWTQAMQKAVTQPSEMAYTELVNNPNASLGKAYGWLAGSWLFSFLLSALIGFIVSATLAAIFGSQADNGGWIGALGLSGFGLGVQLMLAIPGVIIMLIVISVLNGIVHLTARALGGDGGFDQLMYGYAAFTAPITVISGLLGSIPIVGLLSFVLGIYSLVLSVINVKATYRFGYGKAVVAAFSILLLFTLCACMIVLMLALLGPSIGNVFSEISAGL